MTDLSPIQCPLCKGKGKIKPTSLGNILYIQRAGRGMSMRAVGRETGMSVATISRIESGQQPDFQNGLKIANWCGLSGDDLMSLGVTSD